MNKSGFGEKKIKLESKELSGILFLRELQSFKYFSHFELMTAFSLTEKLKTFSLFKESIGSSYFIPYR